MQVFPVTPVSVSAAPASGASNLASLVSEAYGSGSANISSSVTLLIDFSTEHASWLEFAIPGGAPSCAHLSATISEYNTPRPGRGVAPKYYGGSLGEYRVETNAQLYDGLRYAWLTVGMDAGCAPFTLTGVRSVAQVLPHNYTGSISTGDAQLDAIWYTGAYATRVNLLPNFFGSELMDRSDRPPPFQGDAHVAQAVGLTAFGSGPMWAMVRYMLNFTDSAARSVHDSNIA